MTKVTIHQGHILEILKTVPDEESVHCIVTSPPYWGLRDYGIEPVVWGGEKGCGHQWGEWQEKHDVREEVIEGKSRTTDRWYGDPGRKFNGNHQKHAAGQFCRLCEGWRGSLGLEPTIELYVEHLVLIFREVRRVLRPEGTVWLNLGDSYNGSGGAGGDYNRGGLKEGQLKFPGRNVGGLKPKDLCGIPWRVALALQADGWWLRSDIIWSKANPMPESCTDRPTTAHEHIFLLAKSGKYFYDQEAVKCNREGNTHSRGKKKTPPIESAGVGHKDWCVYMTKDDELTSRNLRSVWTLATEPFPQAHFATFPPAIPERCIKAGTSEKGCCPKCGAPWKRLVEKEKTPDHQDRGQSFITNLTGERGSRKSLDAGGQMLAYIEKYVNETNTLGWIPTCTHYPRTSEWREYIKARPGKELTPAQEAENEKICHLRAELMEFWAPMPVVPAVCLDPFAGAGTTGLVAAKMGRDAVLIEIKPEYCAMSEKRIKKDLGMLVELVRVNHA